MKFIIEMFKLVGLIFLSTGVVYTAAVTLVWAAQRLVGE